MYIYIYIYIYSIIWENRTASGPSLKFGFHSSSVFKKPRFLGTRKRSDSVIHNAQHFAVHINITKCVYICTHSFFEISYDLFLCVSILNTQNSSNQNKHQSTLKFNHQYTCPVQVNSVFTPGSLNTLTVSRVYTISWLSTRDEPKCTVPGIRVTITTRGEAKHTVSGIRVTINV